MRSGGLSPLGVGSSSATRPPPIVTPSEYHDELAVERLPVVPRLALRPRVPSLPLSSSNIGSTTDEQADDDGECGEKTAAEDEKEEG